MCGSLKHISAAQCNKRTIHGTIYLKPTHVGNPERSRSYYCCLESEPTRWKEYSDLQQRTKVKLLRNLLLTIQCAMVLDSLKLWGRGGGELRLSVNIVTDIFSYPLTCTMQQKCFHETYIGVVKNWPPLKTSTKHIYIGVVKLDMNGWGEDI